MVKGLAMKKITLDFIIEDYIEVEDIAGILYGYIKDWHFPIDKGPTNLPHSIEVVGRDTILIKRKEMINEIKN